MKSPITVARLALFGALCLSFTAPTLSGMDLEDSAKQEIRPLIMEYYKAVQNEDVDALAALHLFRDAEDRELKTTAMRNLFKMLDTTIEKIEIRSISLHPDRMLGTVFLDVNAEIADMRGTDSYSTEKEMAIIVAKESGNWRILRVMSRDQYESAVRLDMLDRKTDALLDEYKAEQRDDRTATPTPQEEMPSTGPMVSEEPEASIFLIEDFSSDANWYSHPGMQTELIEGGFLLTPEDTAMLELLTPIPMENVVIEFDIYTEAEGVQILLAGKGGMYTVSLGADFNSLSTLFDGDPMNPVASARGKVFDLGNWSHCIIIRDNDVLAADCNDRNIIEGSSSRRIPGQGNLRFSSWGARFGLDNLKVYQINLTSKP